MQFQSSHSLNSYIQGEGNSLVHLFEFIDILATTSETSDWVRAATFSLILKYSHLEFQTPELVV